jgi:hypothetical protein
MSGHRGARDYYVRVTLHELSGEIERARILINTCVEEAVVDGDISALDPAIVRETLLKRVDDAERIAVETRAF